MKYYFFVLLFPFLMSSQERLIVDDKNNPIDAIEVVSKKRPTNDEAICPRSS